MEAAEATRATDRHPRDTGPFPLRGISGLGFRGLGLNDLNGPSTKQLGSRFRIIGLVDLGVSVTIRHVDP